MLEGLPRDLGTFSQCVLHNFLTRSFHHISICSFFRTFLSFSYCADLQFLLRPFIPSVFTFLAFLSFFSSSISSLWCRLHTDIHTISYSASSFCPSFSVSTYLFFFQLSIGEVLPLLCPDASFSLPFFYSIITL